MLPKNISFLSLIVSIAIAGVLGSSGYHGYLAMREKAQDQAQAVADFRKWKADYTSLLPVDEKWKTSLRSVAEAKDLLSVYELLGKAPTTNPDALLVEKIEPFKQAEHLLFATRVCLGSTGGSGVTFDAPNFTQLMDGLDVLAKRPDVQMGAVRLTQGLGKAKASVTGLCLLLRDVEGGVKK